jgi:hypothetical protein
MWNCRIEGGLSLPKGDYPEKIKREKDFFDKAFDKVVFEPSAKAGKVIFDVTYSLFQPKQITALDNQVMDQKVGEGLKNLVLLSKVLGQQMKSPINLSNDAERSQAVQIIQNQLGLDYIQEDHVVRLFVGKLLDTMSAFSEINQTDVRSMNNFENIIESGNSIDTDNQNKKLDLAQIEKNLDLKFKVSVGREESVFQRTGVYVFKRAILNFMNNTALPIDSTKPDAFNNQLHSNAGVKFQNRELYVSENERKAHREVVIALQNYLTGQSANPVVTTRINPVKPSDVKPSDS